MFQSFTSESDIESIISTTADAFGLEESKLLQILGTVIEAAEPLVGSNSKLADRVKGMMHLTLDYVSVSMIPTDSPAWMLEMRTLVRKTTSPSLGNVTCMAIDAAIQSKNGYEFAQVLTRTVAGAIPDETTREAFNTAAQEALQELFLPLDGPGPEVKE